MKNKLLRLLPLLLVLLMLLSAFAGCTGGKTSVDEKPTAQPTLSAASGETKTGTEVELVDIVGQVKLDMNSETKKQEVTVKTYVDGDTTHFFVPEDVMESGVLKARYLGVNTPESTGRIEKWGKQASNFTKEKLMGASSIVVESDDANWNVDSTGSRCLVWVWYQPKGQSDYRNLNIELLQNGLAIASNSANNRYGESCIAALNQAKEAKIRVYSNDVDPLFYEGDIQEVTIKALRTTPDEYKDITVYFEAIIVREYSNTLYVEEYDEDDGIYYGFTVYYGFSADPDCLAFMKLGNRVRFVGSVQYYEAGGTYQVSGLKYNPRKPDESCKLIEEGLSTDYVVTDPAEFNNGKKSVAITLKNDAGESIEVDETYPLKQLLMSTSVAMKDLKVTGVYTTTNDNSSSKGAMTLTCKAPDGTTVDVRTVVLYDAEGNLVTESAYAGKTIDVQGIVDYFSGNYQIKVFTVNDIAVKD